MHLPTLCPRFTMIKCDIFLDNVPCKGSCWLVQDLLDFSFIPGIHEAYEGTRANGDPDGSVDCTMDDLGLDWLTQEDMDDMQLTREVNNN